MQRYFIGSNKTERLKRVVNRTAAMQCFRKKASRFIICGQQAVEAYHSSEAANDILTYRNVGIVWATSLKGSTRKCRAIWSFLKNIVSPATEFCEGQLGHCLPYLVNTLVCHSWIQYKCTGAKGISHFSTRNNTRILSYTIQIYFGIISRISVLYHISRKLRLRVILCNRLLLYENCSFIHSRKIFMKWSVK